MPFLVKVCDNDTVYKDKSTLDITIFNKGKK